MVKCWNDKILTLFAAVNMLLIQKRQKKKKRSFYLFIAIRIHFFCKKNAIIFYYRKDPVFFDGIPLGIEPGHGEQTTEFLGWTAFKKFVHTFKGKKSILHRNFECGNQIYDIIIQIPITKICANISFFYLTISFKKKILFLHQSEKLQHEISISILIYITIPSLQKNNDIFIPFTKYINFCFL